MPTSYWRIERQSQGVWVLASTARFPSYGVAERAIECISDYPPEDGPYRIVEVMDL